MAGVAFENVGATGSKAETISIHDFITGDFKPATVAEYAGIGDEMGWQEVAPVIQVRKGNGYDLYYYVTDAWYDNGTADGDYKEGWADMYGCFAGETEFDGMLFAGESVWFKSNAACNIKVLGEVLGTASNESRTTDAEFTMWANAFPTDIAMTDSSKVAFSGLTPVKVADYAGIGDEMGWQEVAQMIQIRKGNGYDLYFYVSDAWYDNGTADGDYKEGWADMYGCFAGETEFDGIFYAGEGFWIKTPTSSPVTVTFSL